MSMSQSGDHCFCCPIGNDLCNSRIDSRKISAEMFGFNQLVLPLAPANSGECSA